MGPGAIKPNLTYIARLRQKCLQSVHFSVSRGGQLRMKPDCHLDPCRASYKC